MANPMDVADLMGVNYKNKSLGIGSKGYPYRSRNDLCKKKTEIRSHQRAAKRIDIASVVTNDEHGLGESNIIIGSRNKNTSDVLMLGSSLPLRCLSVSCISERDLSDVNDESKPNYKPSRSKDRRKQQKRKLPKPHASEQLRYRYIQRLKQVIAAGNSKQNQTEIDHKVDAKMQRYQLRSTELIWLELQSWFNDRSLVDQDQILFGARQLVVKDVLEFVSGFQFNQRNTTLISELKHKIGQALNQLPNSYDCDVHVPYSTQSWGPFGENCRADDRSHTSFAFKHNQELFDECSLENVGSHVTIPPAGYRSLQESALMQVGEIHKLLCVIENLYPSSSMLAREFTYYSSEKFQSKVKTLCCWYNVTTDLRRSFSSLVQILSLGSPNLSPTFESVETAATYVANNISSDDVSYRSNISQLLSAYTHRTLKQKSVKTILHTLITRHFTGLLRAKMCMMPRKCYEQSNISLLAETEDLSQKAASKLCAHFSIGSDKNDTTTSQDCRQCCLQLKPDVRKLQQKKLFDLLVKMENILPSLDGRSLKSKCLSILAEDAPALLSTDTDKAAFNLPSIKPYYLFLPSTILTVMKHCMHQRMKQAMPFFRSSGSSMCLLTAKQLVLESKEMLECAILARDVMHYFVSDIFGEDEDIATLCAYEEDLRSMISTYLDFLNTWLLRMQTDLPHVPRGFQEILEQEWQFTNSLSPHLEFDSVVTCTGRFIKISSDIVGSTKEFLITAINELVRSQSDGNSFTVERGDEEGRGMYFGPGREILTTHVTPNRSKARAGVLWFHRQRSESPHLSRHNSMQSTNSSSPVTTDTSSPVTSPIELNRQTSSTSSSSTVSLPWFKYCSTDHIGYQKRYLFELCRAVRDLFNETRERATRILSFAKELRKNLEPAIAYDIIKDENSGDCPYCSLLDVLHCEGYVLTEFRDAAFKLNWSKNSHDDYIDLENYWIMVPETTLLILERQHSPPCSNRENNESVWPLIHYALFDHIQKQAKSLKEYDDDDDETGKLRCVIFVKKPFMSTDVRRQSEVTFQSKKKANSRVRKSMDGPTCRGQQKTRSDINLLSHNSFGCAFECASCHIRGKSCNSSGRSVNTSRLHRKQHINAMDLLCRNYDLSCDITIVLTSAQDVAVTRKAFTGLFYPYARLAIAQMPIVKGIISPFGTLRFTILQFCDTLMECTECTLRCLELQSDKILQQQPNRIRSSDADSGRQVKSEVNEVMQYCFNFAFDFIKEATRGMSGGFRTKISERHVKLATQWMSYVLKHREKGKGRRPRWSSQGLTFLSSLDTTYWLELDEKAFSEFKQKIDSFIDHLVGDSQPRPNQRWQEQSQESRPLGNLQLPEYEVQMLRSLSNSSSAETAPHSPVLFDEDIGGLIIEDQEDDMAPVERIRVEIGDMEQLIDRKRFEAGIIGRVTDTKNRNPIINLGVRTVNFRWQRGARVGEGAFGRVYTCVNVDSGVVLAMKEVKFHPNDHQKIRSAIDEYTNFEGIKHKNLVQYYGVELHRDEMYIFMEYCDGGTLADICKISLPEAMVRRYSSQILAAIHVLHSRGIVHRDIKGSNVFLDSGGLIKLGDFGSAIKLKDISKTAPGEMVTYIGTTLPYSAPEVINTSERTGYGRASDIWSLGCVVIEMASGKQPWHDLERFQVMFRIGSGERPPVPDSLSEEGKNFIELCTIPNQVRRWTANQLLGHSFIKVSNIDEGI